MTYITWAILGMAGYSAATLFFKLATRAAMFNAFAVLSMATAIVVSSTASYALMSGAFSGKTPEDFVRPSALYSYAAGIALTIAVGSLVKGLSLGPASVVVPIYGMFILGGTILGIVFLGEPVTTQKVAGLLLAVAGVYLVAA
jgi:transporter family protein